MSADGYISVPLGANTSMGKEGSKNKAKIPQSGRAGGVFVMSDDRNKIRKLARIVWVVRENDGEECRGIKRRAV